MLLGALVVFAVMQFVLDIRPASGAMTIGLWAAVTLAAALVGKAAGLVGARVRRRRLYSKIERTLAGRRHRRG